MKFGQIWAFKYTSKNKKHYDKSPNVYVLDSDKEYMIGFNLRLVPKSLAYKLITILDSQLLKESNYNQHILTHVNKRREIISGIQFAKIVSSSGDQILMRKLEQENKISATQAFMVLNKILTPFNLKGIQKDSLQLIDKKTLEILES
jgi:hypothetical protein